MKKTLAIIFLAVSILYAQSDKGKISFTFNGEKIDLPVTSVLIQYENNILVSARGEYNDSTVQQIIAIEMGFKKLSPEKSARSFPIKIDINLSNNVNKTRKSLSVQFDENGLSSGNKNYEAAHYSIFTNGERISWDINTLHLTFDVSSVVYTGRELKISGTFSGTFSSTLAPKEQFAEIKDGKFEIII